MLGKPSRQNRRRLVLVLVSLFSVMSVYVRVIGCRVPTIYRGPCPPTKDDDVIMDDS